MSGASSDDQDRGTRGGDTLRVARRSLEKDTERAPTAGAAAGTVVPGGKPGDAASRGSNINALFSLLSRLDTVEGTASVLVRPKVQGKGVGVIVVSGGRICSAASVDNLTNLTDSLEMHREAHPDLSDKLDECAKEASRQGRRVDEIIKETKLLPAAEVKAVLRRQIARETVNIVRLGGSSAAVFEATVVKSEYDADLTFSSLDVLIEAVRPNMDRESDFAGELYNEWAGNSDGALLLLRPRNKTYLPVPSEIHGLGDATLAELRSICRSASEMCQPGPLVKADILPQLTTFAVNDGVWICAAGERRYALIRVADRAAAARVLSQAIRLLKT